MSVVAMIMNTMHTRCGVVDVSTDVEGDSRRCNVASNMCDGSEHLLRCDRMPVLAFF